MSNRVGGLPTLLAGLVVVLGTVPEVTKAQSASASVDQVRVITSGGFTAAFNILGPLFEQATGIEVVTEYGSSMGGGPESIPVRLARGETFDILIMNRPPLDGLADDGRIRATSRVNLARSAIGLAVRSGAPKPDISTREALVDTLLAAESVAFSASVSGTYLSTELFPELGVWDEIESKTVRVVTERVAQVVARGEAEIGFQAVSAILPIEGADFVGTIPVELDQETWFSAGIMQEAANVPAAQRLIEFLNSAAAAAIIESTGLFPNPQ